MQGIITLWQLQSELGITGTADEPRLRQAIRAAEDGLIRLTGRRFTPSIVTRTQPVHDATTVLLDDDLLQLTALTTENGSSINPADVTLLPGNGAPASALRVENGGLYGALAITGTWGWHDGYAQAWHFSGDLLEDDMLIFGAQVVVSDVQAEDESGQYPRFQIGQIIRVGDEMMRITDISIGQNTLTVQRAINGSTSAAHDSGDLIYTYHPPADVVQAAVMWAAWLVWHPEQAQAGGLLPDAAMVALRPLIRYAV